MFGRLVVSGYLPNGLTKDSTDYSAIYLLLLNGLCTDQLVTETLKAVFFVTDVVHFKKKKNLKWSCKNLVVSLEHFKSVPPVI